ncbi:unnamed protein product [Ixodes persulcatus]
MHVLPMCLEILQNLSLFIYVCKTKKTGFVHMRYAIYFFRDGNSCVLSREYPGKCSP